MHIVEVFARVPVNRRRARRFPAFTDEQAAAEFVEAHSVAPYVDGLEEITDEVTVELRRTLYRVQPGTRGAGDRPYIARQAGGA